MPRRVSKAVALATNHAPHDPHEPLVAAAASPRKPRLVKSSSPPRYSSGADTGATWQARCQGFMTLPETLKRLCPHCPGFMTSPMQLLRFHMRSHDSKSKSGGKAPRMSFSTYRRSSALTKESAAATPSKGEPNASPQPETSISVENTPQKGKPASTEASPAVKRASFMKTAFTIDQIALARELKHFAHDAHEESNLDIVQMSSPMYFVEEDERKLTVDIMRLGSLEGKCKVEYFTEDGSAAAGVRYKQAKGKVYFRDGEHTKPVDLWVINNDAWATTLEFKIHLTNPEGCEIGPYLHSARIKIIDNDTFPSSTYEDELSEGEDGISKIAGWKLLLEYFKLNLTVDGVAWRTVVILILDQLHNIYKYVLLRIQIYLVDVLFNLKEAEEKTDEIWLKGGPEHGRIYTARLIAGLYIVPMFFLHAWDVQRVYLDLGGLSREFLQLNLFRKYLNYSEDSRQKVPSSHMQVAIIRDCDEVAEGYTSTLQLLKIVGKLIIVTQFILAENPSALTSVFLMPTVMLVFVYFRISGVIELTELTALRTAEVVGVVNEAVTKYGLIADYHQRPQIVDLFDAHCLALNDARLPMEKMQLNNNYASKWLGPIFTGVYIAMNAQEVLRKESQLPLGVFLATITVFRELAENFEEAYEELMDIFEAVGPLRKLTHYLNAETDLKRWKEMNRQRRELTKIARLEVLKEGGEFGTASPNSPEGKTPPTASGSKKRQSASPAAKRKTVKSPPGKKTPKDKKNPPTAWKTDQITFKVRGMSFKYFEGAPYTLRNVNVDVAQGSLVAVVGEHGSGKATLLRLLGHNRFPTEGQIFIPTHLRIVHVPKEPLILNLSAWTNLTFGRHQTIPKRVGLILRDMSMFSTLELIRDELAEMGREGELHYDEIMAGHPHLQEESDEDEDEDEEEEEDEDASDSAVESSETWSAISDHGEEKEGVVPWQEKLSATEKHKIHLARALIMNPEVLVLHKPVTKYDTKTAAIIMRIIKEHVQNRGFHVSAHSVHRRRPRTCIFTPSNAEQMQRADRVWLCRNGSVRDMSLQDLMDEKHRQKLHFFEDEDEEDGGSVKRFSLKTINHPELIPSAHSATPGHS